MALFGMTNMEALSEPNDVYQIVKYFFATGQLPKIHCFKDAACRNGEIEKAVLPRFMIKTCGRSLLNSIIIIPLVLIFMNKPVVCILWVMC